MCVDCGFLWLQFVLIVFCVHACLGGCLGCLVRLSWFSMLLIDWLLDLLCWLGGLVGLLCCVD